MVNSFENILRARKSYLDAVQQDLTICFRPKVIAAKDLPPKTSPDSNFKLYDAILQSEKRPKTPEPDSEMDKFLPMLQDYLKSGFFDHL